MHHCSLLLCGVSNVGALFLIIILLILKVLLTKLPNTTSISIRCRSKGGSGGHKINVKLVVLSWR